MVNAKRQCKIAPHDDAAEDNPVEPEAQMRIQCDHYPVRPA